MERFDLEAMNKTDLMEHADVQGIKILPGDTKGTIIDRILGVLPAPANGALPPEQKPERKKLPDLPDISLNALHTLDGKRITGPVWEVMIHETQTERGPVDATVNGYAIRVQRGHWVRVLEPYVKVLENAVINTFEKDPDTGEEIPRSIHNYPFQSRPVASVN